MTGLPGLPVEVAGLGPVGASPCLEAPGGDSNDGQHSRHESLHTVYAVYSVDGVQCAPNT